MILGSVCIGFIVLLVQSVEGEKEASAARQAKLALDIANKTLPLFRHVNSESLRKVCEIIRDDIHADAVAITNTDHVLAYVGVGEHNYQNGDDFISPTTRQAMNYGKIIIKNNDEAHRTPEIHSMLVIPLWEKGVVTGTLKIYYCHAHQITSSLQEMAAVVCRKSSPRNWRFHAPSSYVKWQIRQSFAPCKAKLIPIFCLTL